MEGDEVRERGKSQLVEVDYRTPKTGRVRGEGGT